LLLLIDYGIYCKAYIHGNRIKERIVVIWN
jgi:hypothetical protein